MLAMILVMLVLLAGTAALVVPPLFEDRRDEDVGPSPKSAPER